MPIRPRLGATVSGVNDSPRLVPLVIAVGAIAVAGVAAGLVLARRARRLTVEERAVAEPEAAQPPTDDTAAHDLGPGRPADLSADMRPDDPSYGPII